MQRAEDLRETLMSMGLLVLAIIVAAVIS